MATNEGWTAEVCLALEKLGARREDAQTTRKSKFDEYKTLETEIAEAVASGDDELATTKKAEAFDVKAEIDALAARISWYADRTQAIIKEATAARKDPALFETIDTSTTPPKPKPPANPQQHLPVGKPGKKPVPPAAPETGDGWAEHMKASVNELDLGEKLLVRLADAGFKTIGQLGLALDNGFEGMDLSTKEFNHIKKIFIEFRKTHTKAAHAVETGT